MCLGGGDAAAAGAEQEEVFPPSAEHHRLGVRGSHLHHPGVRRDSGLRVRAGEPGPTHPGQPPPQQQNGFMLGGRKQIN